MEAPPQEKPQGPSQPEAEGDAPSKIAQAVFTGLMQLTELAQAGGVPPELVQELGGVAQAFEAVMDKIMNGGAAPQPAAPKGPTQGGPGAVPV